MAVFRCWHPTARRRRRSSQYADRNGGHHRGSHPRQHQCGGAALIATAAPPTLRVVLFEGVGSQPLASTERLDMLRSLLEKGFKVTLVRPGGQVTEAASGFLLVLGRFLETRPADAEAMN